MSDKPNPGSEDAIEQGCTCPVVDNHYGEGVPNGDGPNLFWYSERCPVHTRGILKRKESGEPS